MVRVRVLQREMGCKTDNRMLSSSQPQLRPEPSSSCPSAAFEAKGVKVCDASICAGPLRLPAVPPEDMR